MSAGRDLACADPHGADHRWSRLPPHWRVTRLKRVLAQIGSGGTPQTDAEEYWTDEGGIPWVAIADMSSSERVVHTARQLTAEGLRSKRLDVWPAGTLLFSMYASLGHVATLGVAAATNQAILALLPSQSISPGFLKRWLEHLQPQLVAEASSNTQDNLNAEKVRNLVVVVPPRDEQVAISAFLDHETAKIHALVAEQEHLIDLLKEKRQAVISHAVTKGLDPNAPMKDSGIEWLGEVPAHWDVRKLKQLSPELTVGIVVEPSKLYAEHGVPALRSLNVRPGALSGENLVKITQAGHEQHAKSRLRTGDLVAVRTGQPGTTAVIPPEFDGCNCIDLIVIRKPTTGSEFFLCWYLASAAALHQFSEGSGGAIQQHFNVGTAANLIVTSPPAPEQQAIVAHINTATARLDGLIGEATRAITLLQERRTALISAAVTGQIDVRGFVPPPPAP